MWVGVPGDTRWFGSAHQADSISAVRPSVSADGGRTAPVCRRGARRSVRAGVSGRCEPCCSAATQLTAVRGGKRIGCPKPQLLCLPQMLLAKRPWRAAAPRSVLPGRAADNSGTTVLYQPPQRLLQRACCNCSHGPQPTHRSRCPFALACESGHGYKALELWLC